MSDFSSLLGFLGARVFWVIVMSVFSTFQGCC